jgi:cobalt-zinc-cadmium efflux system protein
MAERGPDPHGHRQDHDHDDDRAHAHADHAGPGDDHDHDHDHHHHGIGGHSHAPASFGTAFAIGILLNGAYVLAEAFWGVSVHSVALLADAGHNLGDVIGLFGAWFASWLSRKGPKGIYTYGLRRSSILAALANAVILLVVTGAIAWEAIGRLVDPQQIGGLTIVAVALAGVFVNGITAWLFASGRKGDINIRATFVHMAADMSLALGVAIAGGVIMLTGWLWVDPAMSLIISVVIVVTTWALLRDSVNLSLDAVPPEVDQDAVKAYLASVPGVQEVHDLHIWALGTTETALTAHLVAEGSGNDPGLVHSISEELRQRFHIGHATLQLETPELADKCGLRPQTVV